MYTWTLEFSQPKICVSAQNDKTSTSHFEALLAFTQKDELEISNIFFHHCVKEIPQNHRTINLYRSNAGEGLDLSNFRVSAAFPTQLERIEPLQESGLGR